MSGVIRAGALLRFRQVVTEMGGNPEEMLRRWRIPVASLDDEDLLIPLRSYVQLLHHAATVLHCPQFGLKLGHRQDIGIFGPLAVAIQHSRTVGEALECTSRWVFVQSQSVALTVIPHCRSAKDLTELRFEILDRGVGGATQFVDQSLAVLDAIARHLGGSRYRLRAVALDHAPSGPLTAYRQIFGAPIRVAQPKASLFFDNDLLGVALRTTDDLVSRIASDYLDSHFARPDQSVVTRVRQILARTIGAATLSRERVASLIGLHPRTLQRHLAQEGVSFEEMRDEIRKTSALRYLTGTRLSMSEIAQLVGLSQGSALTRACRRWFRATPQMIRSRSDDHRT